MITFAEDYCFKNYPLHKYELLTGKKNIVAQSLYGKLGYTDDELHLSKRINNFQLCKYMHLCRIYSAN